MMKNEELVHSSFWEGVTEGIMKFHFDTKIDNVHDDSQIEIIVKAKNETDIHHTGEQVWIGSILVGEYLLDQFLNHLIQNPVELTILEVGSGTGVLSILLSFYVKKIICTDYLKELITLEQVGNVCG